MKNNFQVTDNTPPLHKAEDINVLFEAYSLSEFNYVNISKEEQMGKIMMRYPLFSELAQLTTNELLTINMD